MTEIIVLAVVIVAILAPTFYSLSRDGYRRVPHCDCVGAARERYFSNGGNTP